MKRPAWLVPFGLGVLAAAMCHAVLAHSELADWIATPLLLQDTSEAAEAIVVLGAGEDAWCVPNLSSIRRTMLAVEIYRTGRAPMMVFTGGKPRGGEPDCPVGQVMADLAIQLGVPRDRVVVEDRSRNTWENANETARLLRPLGVRAVLLVTDSVHMRRAQACFRTLGYHTERASVPAHRLYPNNLYLLRDTVHEYVGYWYYRFKGRIRADPS